MKCIRATPVCASALAFGSLVLGAPATICAQNVGESASRIFPADAGLVNVKEHYGAKGDGTTDDTTALQRAIDENKRRFKVLYFPDGTYLVSAKLTYGTNLEAAKQLVLQGQSRDKTVIRLADAALGFGDPKTPNYLLTMFEGKATGQAFGNAIRDMTFDTGANNPGAVGIQWMNNNMGSLINVTVRSGDPNKRGAVGIDLRRTEPGPGLFKNVTIEGFDYGLDAWGSVFSMTLEHVTLRDQRVAGIRNDHQVLTIRDLFSENAVPVLHQISSDSTVFLFDSRLRGKPGAASQAAIVNKGRLLLRNVRAFGYAKLVDNHGAKLADVPTPHVAEYVSHKPRTAHSAFGGPRKTLGLPVEETPDVPWDPLSRWAGMDIAALKRDEDDTATIQTAFDRAARENKTTVYFPGGLPGGTIRFGDTVRIHGGVRRVLGMDTTFSVTEAMRYSGKPLFRIENLTRDVLVIERFTVVRWNGSDFYYVEQNTPKTLVMRHINSYGGKAYKGGMPGSKLFVEDVCGAPWVFNRQKVWMRQINPESNKTMIFNRGGDLWVLGLKTENGGSTVIETTNNGSTELLGGLNYHSWKPLKEKQPMFVVKDGRASFSYVATSFTADRNQPTHIRETRGDQTRDLMRDQADSGGRGGGTFPLLTAGADKAGPARPARQTPAKR